MQLLNMETKWDANLTANIGTNCTNLSKEMSDVMDRLSIQVEELEKVLKEQSSRELMSPKLIYF